MAASPYFDCTYFAQAYFDTSDCTSPGTSQGGRWLLALPANDDEEQFALI